MTNVYILIGYNSRSGETLSEPILKLLPLTDISASHNYFGNTRMNTTSNTGWVPKPDQNGASVTYTTVTVAHTPTTTVMIGGPTPSSQTSNANDQDKAAGALDLLEASASPSSDPLNLPSGSLSDQLRHCLPAIILGLIIFVVIVIGVAIWVLIRRRRGSGSGVSAYKNLHNAEHIDSSRTLYGHDEESTAKYSDPYEDHI